MTIIKTRKVHNKKWAERIQYLCNRFELKTQITKSKHWFVIEIEFPDHYQNRWKKVSHDIKKELSLLKQSAL